MTVAFSFGALDALGRAVDPDLPINHVLRLRGNANALNRAACQNETRLEKAQRTQQDQAEAEPPADIPASSDTPDLLAFVRPVPAGTASLSRQQRRFQERQEEKQRQRQQQTARRAVRAVRGQGIALTTR